MPTKILKNTSFLLFANIIVGIFAFTLNIIIARFLGDINFGKYSFALAFTGMFAIFSNIGLGLVITRDIAKDKSQLNNYFWNALILEGVLSIICFILIFCSINIKKDISYDTKFIVYIIGLAVIIDSFSILFKSVFRAFENMEYEALVLIVGKFIFLILVGIVIYFNKSLVDLSYSYLLSSSLSFLICCIIMFKKFPKLCFDIDLHFWRYLLITSLPFGLCGFLNLIYVNTDTIMLSTMKNDAVVGWYNAAYTLASSLSFFSNALTASIFPAMSNAFNDNKSSFSMIYNQSLRYSLIFIFPIAIGTTLISDKIILTVYGQNFIHSIEALQILIWSSVFSFLNSIFYTTLGATNRQNTTSIVMGIGALVNVLLNYLLIPKFSYIGSGIATILTQFVCLLTLYFIISKYIKFDNVGISIIKSLTASIGMGIFILYFKNINFLSLVVISISIYSTLLILATKNKKIYFKKLIER